MNQDQIDQILDEFKKISFVKLITRDLQHGKKFVFFNRSFYHRKCVQVALVFNDYNDEVKIIFIYWPRFWAKVKIVRRNTLSSPSFLEWKNKQIEDLKNHLESLNGFSKLSLN